MNNILFSYYDLEIGLIPFRKEVWKKLFEKGIIN
jgi:hypothetical protein